MPSSSWTKQRRALLTESEAIQAARNKLNKNIGRLRGDKKLDDAMPQPCRAYLKPRS